MPYWPFSYWLPSFLRPVIEGNVLVDKIIQMAPLYQLLYIIPQFIIVISVMAICLMELTILVGIPGLGVGP